MDQARGSGGFLLALYGAAREMAEAQFQEHALLLIKPRLGFDAALWGTGTTDCRSIAASSAHLHEVDPQALREWKVINVNDPAVPNTTAVWGQTVQFHVPTLFSTVDDAAARDYAARWKRRYFLATAQHDESRDGLQWMSLYRLRDRAYTEDERCLCQALMPHFAEALRINRALALARALDALGAAGSGREQALALVDARGHVRYAQRRFLSLLAAEWPQFDAHHLPAALAQTVADAGADQFTGRWIRVRIRRGADCLLLEACPKSMLDALSPQRARVARLFAQGYTHKAIARELHLQPATVRNHLAAAYRELNVRDRWQLQLLDSSLLRPDLDVRAGGQDAADADAAARREPVGQNVGAAAEAAKAR